MPIKATSNDKGMWITWETPDEGISTTFRLKKGDSDQEILGKLFRLTRFIASQMGELATEIAELELQILGSAPVGPGSSASANPSATSASTPSAGPTATPPTDAPRIQMPSPATLSDKPAGGLPPRDGFGWGDMPTTVTPDMAASPMGWEMIPPGEA